MGHGSTRTEEEASRNRPAGWQSQPPAYRGIRHRGVRGAVHPEHLSDNARGCIATIKMSMPAGIYSALDSFILSAFATAWALHKRAALEIANPDFTVIVKSKRGSPQASAWVHIATRQAQLMATLGDRLGLDPKSRAALKLPDAKQRKSKFDGLLGLNPNPNSNLKN